MLQQAPCAHDTAPAISKFVDAALYNPTESVKKLCGHLLLISFF